VGAITKTLKSHWGQETSDPAKVALVILRLAASDHLPAHLLLGSDAAQYASQAEASRGADTERWREISISMPSRRILSAPVLNRRFERVATAAAKQ
jgi:hypothetical protein